MQMKDTMKAETLRRKRHIAILGKCPDCDQPVTDQQESISSRKGVRHVLCFYEPAYALRTREKGRAKVQ